MIKITPAEEGKIEKKKTRNKALNKSENQFERLKGGISLISFWQFDNRFLFIEHSFFSV